MEWTRSSLSWKPCVPTAVTARRIGPGLTVQITALPPTDGPVPDGRATGRTTGLARLLATPAGGRTRLIRSHSEGQLRVLRTHWIDQALPDLATVLLAHPGGGILQGDRLRLGVQNQGGGPPRIPTNP